MHPEPGQNVTAQPQRQEYMNIQQHNTNCINKTKLNNGYDLNTVNIVGIFPSSADRTIFSKQNKHYQRPYKNCVLTNCDSE